MAAKEHEEWNKKKKRNIIWRCFSALITMITLTEGNENGGPRKIWKKRQAANNKPKIGAHTSGRARSDRRLVENFFYLF